MSVERHLALQEMTLLSSAEWSPGSEGWLVARVADGAGYWFHAAAPRELNAGDVLVAPAGSNGVLRASRLGPLRLQFFFVQPHLLNGVLAVADGRQLESASAGTAPQ